MEPKLGIQLYTVRDLIEGAAFRDILRGLAGMGFKGFEFAWKYGGLKPAELGNFLAELGVECCGLHADLDELLVAGHRVYEYALAARSRFITTSLAGSDQPWDVLLPRLDRAGRIAADHGLVFTYHNHWQEFIGSPGPHVYERIVAETDPELVRLELDIGWVRKAGLDPLALWRRLGARVPQIHLRDYDVARDARLCDIGAGFIDVGRTLAQARELRTEWVIYEQDHYPVDALTSCRVCIDRVRAAATS